MSKIEAHEEEEKSVFVEVDNPGSGWIEIDKEDVVDLKD